MTPRAEVECLVRICDAASPCGRCDDCRIAAEIELDEPSAAELAECDYRDRENCCRDARGW